MMGFTAQFTLDKSTGTNGSVLTFLAIARLKSCNVCKSFIRAFCVSTRLQLVLQSCLMWILPKMQES